MSKHCEFMDDLIIAVIQTTWAVVKFKSEKNSGLFFSDFNFTTAQVVCITSMINHKFISFSAVQIYDLSYIHLHCLNTIIKKKISFL